MKIIGITGTTYDKRYIVEIEEFELAKVCGFNYVDPRFKTHLRDLGAMSSADQVRYGVEIPVSDFWQRLADIRDNEVGLKKQAETLRALASLIEQSSPAAILPKTEKIQS